MTEAVHPAPLLSGRRVSAEDLVYTELRRMLSRGEYAPGSQLSEDALARTLGVSRTPLRQALGRLRFERLVDRSPSGRLFATSVSPDDADKLFSVRIALEQLALREAFAHITDDLLARLTGVMAQMASMQSADSRLVADYGGEFHDVLYQASDNQVCLALLAQLQGRIDRYRFISTATGMRRQRKAVLEHGRILAALEARDLAAALDALTRHLEAARVSVTSALRSGQTGDRAGGGH